MTSTSVATNGADALAGSRPHRRKMNGSIDPAVGAEHDYPYQAAPYGESDDRVVRPIGTLAQRAQTNDPRHANDAEHAAQNNSCR